MSKEVVSKTCTKCNTEKPISEFWKHNKKSNDGYYFWCKSCQKEYARQRYAVDPKRREKDAEKHKRFKEEHPEEYRRRQRESERRARKRNPDKFREKNRKQYAKNPDKYKEYRERYAAKPKIEVTSKVCTRCGTEKVASEFRRNKNTKDGLQYWCKACQNEDQRIRFRDDKDFKRRRLSKSEKWAKANPDKQKEYSKRSAKTYYENHVDRILAYNKKYRQEHPGFNAANQARRKTRKTNNGGSFTSDEWVSLCSMYHGRCVCCLRKKKLTVDHVLPVTMGGTSNIDNIQPLCKSCNSTKNNKHIDYRTSFSERLDQERQKEQHGKA